MKIVFMVIGIPGSGKSWVCEQLTELFEYIPHDQYIGNAGKPYFKAILKASLKAKRPLLIEAPFSISEIKEELEGRGFKITPVFILEKEAVVASRYRKREGKSIPPGHLTRMRTFAERAEKWRAFSGTAEEVLGHLVVIGSEL